MEQEIAYNILLAYFKEGSYLNITLNKALTPDMNRHMKNRITRIVYGTLQNALLLEYQLKKFVKKVKVSEKTILLIGLYEHYFMDIPDYAIERMARCLLPMMQKYYESIEGKEEMAVQAKPEEKLSA